MNQENWQEAKQVFSEALKLPADKRTEYLSEISSRNPPLGEQVKTLLESYESGFLEETVVGKVAEIIGGSGFNVGQQIGRYEIKEIIGAGGMGEVFLANDTELKRLVAIKILHAEVAEDKERVSRFVQEARAASALNHPNILTIHEIGKFENSRFIVSEYVKGETLRERLKRENLSLPESLEIAAQVAAALEAAHEAGIVHRDIKPENIMLRADGLVKVLDFGLAKLTEIKSGSTDSEASTLAEVRTNPGVVMGTVAYMSPEQARGVAIDARTDVWSLGVVLYEMLSGNLPFPGDTTSDIIASILKTEAKPLEDLKKEIPRELESICFKSLEKEPENRYQTAQDFLQDLRRAKKHLENAGEQTTAKQFKYDDQSTEPVRYRPTLSREYLVTSVKRHKFGAFSALALLTFFGIGVGVYKFTNVPKTETSPFTASQKLNIAPLVTSGKVREIVVSPDGKYAAYVSADGNKQSIRLRQIATTSDVEIVPQTEIPFGFGNLSFTPDSNYLYYIQNISGETTLFKVPALGGSPTKILGNIDKYTNIDSAVAVSPDGKTIAFYRDFTQESDDISFLQLANADGTDERTLVKYSYAPDHLMGNAAWSPDGKTIAYAVSKKEKDGLNIKLLGINVSDGSQRQLSEADWSEINDIVWLSDGNLIISGREKGDTQFTPNQLWLIAPNAPPQLITNDRYGYSRVSATAKGDTLVAIQSKMPRNLWIAPNNDASSAKQITSSGEIGGGISWAPDGKFIFGSHVNASIDIITMNPDGSNRKQLTANQGLNPGARMTTDRRYIIFQSNRVDSTYHIFRMDADGSNPKQLTNGISESRATSSLDGKWVYYIQETPGSEPNNICKIPIDGGTPIKVADARMPSSIAVSPRTGMTAYVNSEDWRKGGLAKIIIISPDDNKPIKTLLLPRTASGGFIKWTPDERAITFNDSRNGGANIWAIPIDGKGEAKPLTNFTTEQTLGFDWSPDGKQLLVSRGTQTTEAVIITRAK